MGSFVMKEWLPCICAILLLATGQADAAASISEASDECLSCHAVIHPGMVAGWNSSRHAKVSPAAALEKPELERRVSAEHVPEALSRTVVGCAECHTLNPEKHQDTFEHNGYEVHVVVSPKDCETCHPVEVRQYSQNLMSHAYKNLKDNSLYQDLAEKINSMHAFENGKIQLRPPDSMTEADSCYYCHGTSVEVTGQITRETDFGAMVFPVLDNWPNQGVGRLNPDQSMGACTACHTRHTFSIEIARKPHTCSECHHGPDVPAYPVYKVSKHGNIYESLGKSWDFESIPWLVGEHLTAPTCATCHISLLINEDEEVIAERTHQINNRLPWRIFGLIYAHPHPLSPDTTVIRNAAGLPLPTELTGEPADDYLIDGKEQTERRQVLQRVCLACHGDGWVEGHFARFENTIKTTNEMTRNATQILLMAWEKGLAKGLAQNDSVFNDAIEKRWMDQWLFYANSTRFASAMAGADYGVFANGRWRMSKNIVEMLDWLELRLQERR
jgi:hypothetical protein